MKAETIRCYAEISASIARIEGMKAENQQRAVCGESPAYVADDFFTEATNLEQHANFASGIIE